MKVIQFKLANLRQASQNNVAMHPEIRLQSPFGTRSGEINRKDWSLVLGATEASPSGLRRAHVAIRPLENPSEQ
jgi:hypothetical protein